MAFQRIKISLYSGKPPIGASSGDSVSMNPNPGKLGFDALNAALKAAGEETRLRVLALLAEAELTVSDLTDILRQSQPRISRHLKLLAEAGLVERFREGTWAFFRLAESGGGAEVARALIERLDPADQTIARDRDAACLRAAGARRRRASLFPRACRRMGPHPQAARHRRSGRGRDPRRARRQAVPLAARSRHRHRAHARNVRAADRARARSRPLARHAALGARPARARRPAKLQRATGRHLRPAAAPTTPSTSSSCTRCCTSSTTARAPSARPRACCARAGGCWWSISRRTNRNFCASNSRTAVSALRPRR